MRQLLEPHYKRYRYRLKVALLACQSMENRDLRIAVINELPAYIRQRRDENLSTAVTIVDNLIQTAVRFENGLDDLINVIADLEGNTFSMQLVHDEWRQTQKAIEKQEQLIEQLKASQLNLKQLRKLYRELKPVDYHVKTATFGWLVAALWEMPQGHDVLQMFMQHVATVSTSPIQKQPNSDNTHLIVMIEPSRQAEDSWLWSLWANHNGQQDNLLPRKEVKLNQLEAEVTTKLELWTAVYHNTQAIEFYLPKALLKLPVDAWEIGKGLAKQRLVDQYHISRGTLERYRARAISKQLKQLTISEQHNLLKAVQQMPLVLELMRHSNRWQERWQRLQQHEQCQFQLLVESIAVKSIKSLADLQEILSEKACFALLNFKLHDLASEELDDPMSLLLIIGLPLIAWERQDDGTTAFRRHLKAKVLDAHCDHIIQHGATDIVKLIHKIQRHRSYRDDYKYQIGRELNLVLDNPERELPLELERIRM